MKPFALTRTAKEKNFNYCLSKCRRVSVCAFGHLKARFRRIGKGLENSLENTTKIVKACCVLHNFLNEVSDPVNQTWIERQLEYELSHQQKQPQPTTSIDLDNSGHRIRDALANSLAILDETAEEEAGREGSGVDVTGYSRVAGDGEELFENSEN